MGVTIATFGEPTRHFDTLGNEVDARGRRLRRGAVVTAPDRCPTPSPFGDGANCRRRRCPYCGRAWVMSWEIVSRVNLDHYGGALVIISITAPGASRLPWSCERTHKHSGPAGCKVKEDYADVWAAAAPKQLAKLRDAARLAVKREGLPVDRLWLERVWEPQKRGVPHAHIVAGAATPIERHATERFVFHLRRLRTEYGFGDQLHVTRPMQGAEAARYIAGYLLGRSSKGKRTVRDNLGDPRMPASLIYVARALTRETQMTMRHLRYVRWFLMAKRGRSSRFPELYGDLLITIARLAAQLERAQAPPEQAFRENFRLLIRNRREHPTELGRDLPWRMPVAA